MISKEQIVEIKSKIIELVYDQVENGLQSKNINFESNDVKACGQFIMRNRVQRGVHGTSAALRILAESQAEKNKALIPKLIKYLINKNEIESTLSEGKTKPDANNDDNNIIKLAEQLYSLSFIKTGQGDNNILAKSIQEKLIACKIDNKGWSYFVDDKSGVELLPTVFVLMALYSNNFSSKEVLENVLSDLANEMNKPITNPSVFAINTFVLYVLTFKVNEVIIKDTKKSPDLKKIFKQLWNSSFCFLEDDIEQNIEYWINESHYYVRVPWQLYLIALSNHYSEWQFTKVKTQNRLNNIYNAFINNGGFKYKYSGKDLSTRTISIVFDTLTTIENNFGNLFLYKILNIIDKIRKFFSKKWIRYLFVSLLLIAFIYSIYLWGTEAESFQTKLAHLGPDILIYFVIIIYEIAIKTK